MANSENIRFATFNVSLNRSESGELITDLSTPDNEQAQNVAEIIQRNNPDVVLLNEFDFDPEGEGIRLFQENYLGVSQNGVDPVEYPYVYLAPSNTGIPSGFDLDNDGTTDGAGDAFGFGFYPGQFGMVLLSKHPIDEPNVRTFQNFIWQDMPGALLPDDPTTPEPADFYSPEELAAFRLSSKSHWDIPIEIDGEIVHVLASHPTPPVFDGEEDRNGRRNHDEIRFWSDYITPGQGEYIYDDAGNFGSLEAGESFVVMGDQNADPFDGDSTDDAILQLLDNPLINTSDTPDSEGGEAASIRQNEVNDTHEGNPAFDTADFNDETSGNLRVDYVLPSADLDISDSGVFWTAEDDPLFRLVGDFDPASDSFNGFPASDHRLVFTDVSLASESVETDINRATVTNLEFLGGVSFETGFTFEGTEVGGISGLVYDEANQLYYALSDDRGNRDAAENNESRFYTVNIDLADGSLDSGDVEFQTVEFLANADGEAFAPGAIDPEGIALNESGNLFIASEGDADNLINPLIGEFTLDGQIVAGLPVDDKFLPTADQSTGIQNNQAFESLTTTPDGRFLFTATENALFQDGERSSVDAGSPVRIVQYDLETESPVAEFLYQTDPIPVPPETEDGFADNGLVELLALDNQGTFLALERSFTAGVGNNIRLYEISLQGATNISSVDSLLDEAGEAIAVDTPVEKRLLLDFDDLGISLDNSEGISFGEVLADGRQSIIVTSDNNFNDAQQTQVLAFAIDTDMIPTVSAVTETPDEIRFGDPENPDLDNAPDADDPAIYLHPEDPAQSFVITTFKDGGLRVYDLAGEEIQSITPENIRYNNVDITYGVEYPSQIVGESATVDLAIVSDRENDTLAIFAINPNGGDNNGLPGSGILTDVTAIDVPESIFGVDDGEATAYGLATYTSVVDGKNYVFVSQADGNQIAQLEIQPGLGAADGLEVSAEVVRTFAVPVPEGEDPADFQVEGMVVDRETGKLFVGQEEFGIWQYDAEPNGSTEPRLVDTVTEDTDLSQVPFSNLVVFGDSLSDAGNVFNVTAGLIPPSPPYSEGRFSNGDLIVDAVTESLELPDSESFLTGGSNYAFGGAQTGAGTSEFGLLGDLPETFDVPNIGQQIELYLATQTPSQTDLFYVYGGANDFIDPLLRGESLPTAEEIVGNITSNITELSEAGAQTFVVPNLPLLGNIPLFAEQPEATAILNDATDEFNQLLDTELDAIAQELDITIVEPDINGVSTEIQNNPAEFGIANTTDAALDLINLSLTGNPDEFFFWDTFHPTAATTEIVAEAVIDVLPGGINEFGSDLPSLVPDVEGLTIYYGEDGNGYLLASSQGNSTFAIYDRAGSNSYLGSFEIADVQDSDGADVINVPLGEDYPAGLLVVQDGSNEPETVFADPEDGEIQNFNTNFKFVSLADFATDFANLPAYDPNAFDPRNPETRTLINGVASGDTTQDSTVLWTRSLVLGNVTFEYATDAEFENIVGTVEAEVTDPTVPVKVNITGLEPGTDYFYRVSDAAGDIELGEFHTSAEVGTYNGFRFGATGDWQQAPPYPSLSNVAAQDLELFVKLGDTIYADIETPALPGVTQARELDEFRIKHGEVLTSRIGLNTVPELYASTSILATIDDHEIVDNFAGGAAPGASPDAPDIGSSDEPLFTDDVEFVNDTQVYEAALQAYQEYHPLEDRFYSDTGSELTANERQLYRFNTYGSDASVIMLDSRSFRDDQIDPVDLTNPDDTLRFLGEAFDPDRTLLGREQVEDFKADLLAADAAGITWKFVTIPEPIQNFGTLNAEDRFEGYAAERNEILQFIDENEIDNVVFMAGDFHGTIVNNLTYQTAPGGEQIPTNAFEIVTGPVAFNDGLFGPTVVDISAAIGAITPEQEALFDSLPVASDRDSEIDDRDDFVKNLLEVQTDLFDYDPVGLNNNLAVADDLIDAELIQGDYVAVNTFGWTEFDVDAETQQLRVITYGVDAYSEEDVLTNPSAISALEPRIVSEFVVNPQGDFI
ncbi:MAG: phytase [Cyanobacteria bacterium J06582_2]